MPRSQLSVWSRRPFAVVVVLGSLLTGPAACALDYGASSSSAWSSAATWTPRGVPGAADSVFIGSSYPGGAAATATVTLTQSQSASNVCLGYSSGDNGTLNLGNFKLDVGNSLYIGFSSNSRGAILRGSGSFAADGFYLGNSNAFTFGSGDSVRALSLTDNSVLTTVATGNVTGSVDVDSGSKLTLGGDMTLTDYFNLQDSGSTLDMGGLELSTSSVYLGWYGSSPVRVAHPGQLMAANLYLSNSMAYTLGGKDSVGTLTLADASVLTTASTSNVTNSVNVESGSTLKLGADMALSDTFNLQDSGSTLAMAGHKLSANAVQFGYNGGPVTVVSPGQLTANSLYVSNSTSYTLGGGDVVGALYLDSSSALTTSAIGNVTGPVNVYNGSKLTLGADMALSGSNSFNLQDAGSTLDMGGHGLSAYDVYFGWNGSSPVTVAHPGQLTAGNLYFSNSMAYTLGSGDAVGSLTLNNSSALTTTATGNIAGSANIEASSKLTLGADTTLSNTLNLQDSGSTLDMGGHKLTADLIEFGYYGGPVTVAKPGQLTANYLSIGNSTSYTLRSEDAVGSLSLYSSSLLTTTATGNVTGTISVSAQSKLILGADVALSNNFGLQDSGSTLDMGGHKLTAANYIYLGWFGSGAVSIANPGPVSTSYLYVGNGNALTVSASGSTVNSQINISQNSQLNVQQLSGQVTGMTFLSSSSDQLSINDTSVLRLSGGSNAGQASWLFRWKDPAAGTWVNTLASSIAAGRIAVSSTSGYSVFDDEGYTYVAAASTLIWNGGASLDTSWSNAANWGGATPTAGHWLRFGALAAGGHAANNNNLPANSLFYGIFFDAAAPSYNLQGNAIELSGDVLNQSGTNQTIGLNLQLVPGDGAFDQGVFDTGAWNITDSGNISGSGMELIKTGTGTLLLSGSNTYSGGTEVLAGELIVASSGSILDGTPLIVGDASAFAAATINAPITAAASAPAPVPEPGTLTLIAAACGGFAYRSLRRRRGNYLALR